MTDCTFIGVYFYQRTKRCVKASVGPAACCRTVCGQVESVNGSNPNTAPVMLRKMNNAVKYEEHKFVL